MELEDWKTKNLEDIPDWLKLAYLPIGHRPPLDCYRKCLWSIMRYHTETGNIWSHLIGFLVIAYRSVVLFMNPICAGGQGCCGQSSMHGFQATEDDCGDFQQKLKLALLFSDVCTLTCLALSINHHVFCCHSEEVFKASLNLDFFGIAIYVCGFSSTSGTLLFYHAPILRTTYQMLLPLTVMALAPIIKNVIMSNDEPWIRCLTFVALSFIGLVNVFHYMLLNGFQGVIDKETLQILFCFMLKFALSGIIYAMKIPERFCPGWVSVWFHSHHIYHHLVVLGFLEQRQFFLVVARSHLLAPSSFKVH